MSPSFPGAARRVRLHGMATASVQRQHHFVDPMRRPWSASKWLGAMLLGGCAAVLAWEVARFVAAL